MKNLVFALCTVAMLAIAPNALGCADCIWPNCDFLGGWAALCWELPEGETEPGGCYTSGRCCGVAATADLGAQLSIASVEIRQSGTVTVLAPQQQQQQPVVAEARAADAVLANR